MKKLGKNQFDAEVISFDVERSLINNKVVVQTDNEKTWGALQEMSDTMLGHGSHTETSHSSK